MDKNKRCWRVFAVIFISFLILLQYVEASELSNNIMKINLRPIIGIPMMTITDKHLMKNKPELVGKSYISASYVKYIEMTGGGVVPIPNGLTEEELLKIFNSINGLIFPGGEVNLQSSEYYSTTKKLFKLAIKANSDDSVFPILGICRGMQAILVHAVGDLSILTLTDARNYTTSLKWISKDSDLLKDIPNDLFDATSKKNITSHFHKYGITPNDFNENKDIKDMYEILATSVDRNNKEFVSIYQGKEDLPFYGLQFHPEKTIFEWAPTILIPHTSQTIRFSQQLANNFMEKVRLNKHRFVSSQEERDIVISNKEPLYIGNLINNHSPFVQIYVF